MSTDPAAATPTATPAPTPRYAPGAPPPAPPSKSKKKKAKSALKHLAAATHEATLSGHAPDVEDVKAGKVDPSLLANHPPPSSGGQDTGNNTDAGEAKAPEDKSVVAELIEKRATMPSRVQEPKRGTRPWSKGCSGRIAAARVEHQRLGGYQEEGRDPQSRRTPG